MAKAAGRGSGAPIPVRARLYAWAVVLIAVAGFAASASVRPAVGDQALLLFGILTAMTALAWRYPVEFAPRIKVYITSAPTFAAVLQLPPALAVASAALGVGVGEVLNRSRPIQQAFNTAVAALTTLAAGVVLAVLSNRPFVETTDVRSGAAVLLAAAVAYLVNALIVETMASLHRGRNLVFDGWWQRHRPMIPQRAALYLLGAFAALIGHAQPWALALVALPAWVVYRSLRDGVALRSQTRDAVEQLADIVDMRDRYTFEHSRRVAELAQALALRLGLGAATAHEIYMAGRVHDVGKIGISSTTLSKATAMEEEEWDEMRSHAEIGARLIGRFPDFAAGREIVLHHHERWDGKGYPNGLAGTDIPLGARVVAVVDTFDAMTSTRAYRQALPISVVYAELLRCRGTQFEPQILDGFLSLLTEQPELVNRTESVRAAAKLPLTPTSSVR
ncbi:MAG: HD-GYP domain-containing protein [Dehalococcoidia bacterium]